MYLRGILSRFHPHDGVWGGRAATVPKRAEAAARPAAPRGGAHRDQGVARRDPKARGSVAQPNHGRRKSFVKG